MAANKNLRECDLIVPVLELMSSNRDGVVQIQDIVQHILDNRDFFLSESDLRMSPTRRGEHIFEQRIRNLRSHNTLEKLGLAENIDGGFKLLPEIDVLMRNSKDWVYDIIDNIAKRKSKSNTVVTRDVRKIIDRIDKRRPIIGFNEITVEGIQTSQVTQKKIIRSRRLRDAALQYFSSYGALKCDCCGFDFHSFYGPTHSTCIEIHHKTPIYMYADEDMKKTIEEALCNLMPVCPNCHRVIHKDHIFSTRELNAFKTAIASRMDI